MLFNACQLYYKAGVQATALDEFCIFVFTWSRIIGKNPGKYSLIYVIKPPSQQVSVIIGYFPLLLAADI